MELLPQAKVFQISRKPSPLGYSGRIDTEREHNLKQRVVTQIQNFVMGNVNILLTIY